MEGKYPFIPHSLYYGSLWRGYVEGQGIRNIGIGLRFSKIQVSKLLGLTYREINSPPWTMWQQFRSNTVFTCISVNEKKRYIKSSLKFVPKGAIDNNPALI